MKRTWRISRTWSLGREQWHKNFKFHWWGGDNHVKNKTGRGTNFEGKVLYSNNHHRLKGTQGIPWNFEDCSVGFIETFFRACGQCMLLLLASEWVIPIFMMRKLLMTLWARRALSFCWYKTVCIGVAFWRPEFQPWFYLLLVETPWESHLSSLNLLSHLWNGDKICPTKLPGCLWESYRFVYVKVRTL